MKHALQNKIRGIPSVLHNICIYSVCLRMPVFDFLRALVRFLFDSVIGLFPESLTRSLTVLEIVYYIVAIVYFLLEIVLLFVR